MSDLIRREDALKELRLDHKDVIYIDKKECARRIKAIPSADRPRGEWIDTGKKNIYGGKCVKCSNCGDEVIVQHLEDEWYCRHCGADMGMKGADDNE